MQYTGPVEVTSTSIITEGVNRKFIQYNLDDWPCKGITLNLTCVLVNTAVECKEVSFKQLELIFSHTVRSSSTRYEREDAYRLNKCMYNTQSCNVCEVIDKLQINTTTLYNLYCKSTTVSCEKTFRGSHAQQILTITNNDNYTHKRKLFEVFE